MRNLCAVILIVCFGVIVTAASFSDDKYYDREVIRQVANWMVQAVRNSESTLCAGNPHKRNSEIINSILGLPKNLNDAGRK